MIIRNNSTPHILVTGGSGFVGSALVKGLLASHPTWRISVLDIQPPKPDIIHKLHDFLAVDITSPFSFASYHPDLVVHTAGFVPAGKARYSTNEADWQRVKSINYDGTRNVVNAALASGCKRFVYTSSCTVVVDDLEHDYFYMNESSVSSGRASLHYGRSKALAEDYVLSSVHAEKGFKACILRPCSIIGEGDTAVIGVLHSLIARGETNFVLGNGDNLYDVLYISNAVDAHILAVENLLSTLPTTAGEIFFISNGEPVYFFDFLTFVWAQFGHYPAWKIRIPAGVAGAMAFLAEWVGWAVRNESTFSRGSVKDGIGTRYASIEKAKRILGYVPKVSISEGIRRACADYEKQLKAQAG